MRNEEIYLGKTDIWQELVRPFESIVTKSLKKRLPFVELLFAVVYYELRIDTHSPLFFGKVLKRLGVFIDSFESPFVNVLGV